MAPTYNPETQNTVQRNAQSCNARVSDKLFFNFEEHAPALPVSRDAGMKNTPNYKILLPTKLYRHYS
jgi:hypothetical protein